MDIAELEKQDRPAAPRRTARTEESPYLGGRSSQQPLLRHPCLPAFRGPVRYRIGEKADSRDSKGGGRIISGERRQAPRVEETYKTLMVQRNNTQTKYDDLMKRVMEAKVSQGLEKEQMGEHFTLIDPASLPEKPVKPNVPAILLIGLFLGIGAGVGTLSLKESGDQSARQPGQLAGATGSSRARGHPLIVTEERQAARRERRTEGSPLRSVSPSWQWPWFSSISL